MWRNRKRRQASHSTDERSRFIKTVERIGNGVKPNRRMTLEEISGMKIDAKVELIQTLIPLGLMHVEEELMR